jgi:CBS domain-containing protein
MKLKEIMTAPAQTIESWKSVKEAADIMKRANVGALPVLRQNELVGIITDRDLVVRGLTEGKLTVPISDLMSSNPISLLGEQSVDDAIETMQANCVGRIVVVDELKRVVGVVSAADVAVACSGDARIGRLAATLSSAHKSTEHLARL